MKRQMALTINATPNKSTIFRSGGDVELMEMALEYLKKEIAIEKAIQKVVSEDK